MPLKQVSRAGASRVSENFVTAGCQEFPLLAWFRQDQKGVVEQPLKPLSPWLEAKAVVPQGHRGVVAIRQAVNDVGTHRGVLEGPEGVAVASGEVK